MKTGEVGIDQLFDPVNVPVTKTICSNPLHNVSAAETVKVPALARAKGYVQNPTWIFHGSLSRSDVRYA